MSGKKAKQQRREIQGAAPDAATRAGRKRLRQLQAREEAISLAACKQAEIDRWNALTPEEQEAERQHKEDGGRRALLNLQGMIGIMSAGIPAAILIPLPAASSRAPHPKHRRGR